MGEIEAWIIKGQIQNYLFRKILRVQVLILLKNEVNDTN